MKRSIIACLCLLLIPNLTLAAPVEWPVSEGGNGHYYAAINNGGIWFVSLQIATFMRHQGVPGHLATLTSAEEDAWVFANVMSSQGIPGYIYHLGGWAAHMFGNPGGLDGWQWLTGEPWEFENWAPGEPNNAGNEGDREKCLAYYFHHYHGGASHVGWNDVAEDYNTGFIVEFDGEDATNHPPIFPVPVRNASWGQVKALFR